MVVGSGIYAEEFPVPTNEASSSTSTKGKKTTDGCPFRVKITAVRLNVRKEPKTSANVSAQVKKGQVYTIVAVEGGFGKLKSGAGWIDLSYAEKVE